MYDENVVHVSIELKAFAIKSLAKVLPERGHPQIENFFVEKKARHSILRFCDVLYCYSIVFVAQQSRVSEGVKLILTSRFNDRISS